MSSSTAIAQPSVDGQLVQSELDELVCGPQTASLWTTVESMLQGPAEADFVKDTVGPSLLREVESARDELRSLLSILSDLRDTNSSSNASPQVGGSTATSPSRQYTTKGGSAPAGASFKPHPPPPGVGQGVSLLQQRLKALLENASEPALEATFVNQREKMVAAFVINGNQRPASSAGSRRPGTRGSLVSRGSSGNNNNSSMNRPFSAASNRSGDSGTASSTTHFDPTATLQPIKAKLRFDKVHEVKDQLADLFRNERDLLLGDIDIVRTSIEEEMTWSAFSQPSNKELTEMSSKLEEKQHQEEHQRAISSLPTSGASGGSATSLLRHRSLPSLAQQKETQQPGPSSPPLTSATSAPFAPTTSTTTTHQPPPPSDTLAATPPKAAPLAPLRVAAPKPTSQPRF